MTEGQSAMNEISTPTYKNGHELKLPTREELRLEPELDADEELQVICEVEIDLGAERGVGLLPVRSKDPQHLRDLAESLGRERGLSAEETTCVVEYLEENMASLA